MIGRAFILATLLALAGSVYAADTSIKVIALFSDKALLLVNGKQKIVKKGETFEGVLLKSASGRGAVVVGVSPVFLNLIEPVTKGAGLLRAPRRVILGVEIQHHLFALEVGQADRLAILVGKRKRRSFLPLLQTHCLGRAC